jgi:hypothetical protein
MVRGAVPEGSYFLSSFWMVTLRRAGDRKKSTNVRAIFCLTSELYLREPTMSSGLTHSSNCAAVT